MATTLRKFDIAVRSAIISGNRMELESYRLSMFERLVAIDNNLKLFCRKCSQRLTEENSKNSPRHGYCENCGKQRLSELAQLQQQECETNHE